MKSRYSQSRTDPILQCGLSEQSMFSNGVKWQCEIMWTYVIIIWCEIWYNDGMKWYDVIGCIMIKMML